MGPALGQGQPVAEREAAVCAARTEGMGAVGLTTGRPSRGFELETAASLGKRRQKLGKPRSPLGAVSLLYPPASSPPPAPFTLGMKLLPIIITKSIY